jgi:TetR/AcrR family transcriptional regulator, transcriptional repressor of aconitase
MATRTRFRGPGRPPAEEGRDRVGDIVSAARKRFTDDGYAGAALSTIASDAGLSLAALYHYFADKPTLFEAVYLQTLEAVWDPKIQNLENLDPGTSLATRIASNLGPESEVAPPGYSTFFAGAQTYVRRIPELRHLLDKREAARRRAFALLVGTLAEEGRIRGAKTAEQAIGMLEVIFSGSSFEGFFNPERQQEHLESALALADAVSIDR